MNKSLLLAVLLLSSSILPACQQKQDQAATGPAVSSQHAKQAKPGAQVSLASANSVTLNAGSLASVDILLGAQVGDGTLHVELTPSEGLQLRGAKNSYEFTRSENGQYALKADLYAEANGRYYLNLNTTVRTGDASSFRSLALIVQVGSLPAIEDALPGLQKKAAGENVISLPAQEQISNQ